MPPFLTELNNSDITSIEMPTITILDSSQDSSPENDDSTSLPPPNPPTEENGEREPTNDELPVEEVLTKCICAGCDKPPIENEQWEGEFCSNECAVKYCNLIFKLWVQQQNTQGK